MITEIGHLHLQLPPGFEHRAQRIGRLVGETLAQRNDLGPGRIDRLSVGPVQVEHRHSDHEVARRIAASIHSAIIANRP